MSEYSDMTAGYRDPAKPTDNPLRQSLMAPSQWDAVERLRLERDALAARVRELESALIELLGEAGGALISGTVGEKLAKAADRAGAALGPTRRDA